jgi:hypothetical protein
MNANVFSRLDYTFDTGRFGDLINLSQGAQNLLNVSPIPLSDWQATDLGLGPVARGNYYQNPTTERCNNLTSNLQNIYITCSTDTANTFPTAQTAALGLATTANNCIIEIAKFKSHTDNISGVSVSTAASSQFPYYDIIVPMGQQMLMIMNKTDGLANTLPLLGNFTSLYIDNELNANNSTIGNNYITISNSFSGNVSNLTSTQLDTMNAYVGSFETFLYGARTQDWTFYQNSLQVLKDYMVLASFSQLGNTQSGLINTKIGTPDLIAKLATSTTSTYTVGSVTPITSGDSSGNTNITVNSDMAQIAAVNAYAHSAYAQANAATFNANSFNDELTIFKSYESGVNNTQNNTIIAVNQFAQSAYTFANTIAGGSAIDNVARVAANTAYNHASAAFASANAKIASITGTTNQIIISGTTAVTLSTPQDIGTSSSVQHGSLGIGTAASGTTGEIRATNEVTAYYSSDETLKENIITITDALGKLKQVRGVMYDWKDSVIQSRGGLDDYFVRKHDTGVIAQDVEKVLPEVVAERPDGTKAVRYEKLAGIIIQAINELADKVEELNKRIE